MSATSVTLRGRAAAERDMLDACTVRRASGSSADPETGAVSAAHTTVYAGKCKMQQTAPAATPTVIGEAEVFIGQMELHLPVSTASAAVAPGDVVTVDTCVLDASLVGKKFKLRGPAHKSFATARRFPLTEVSG